MDELKQKLEILNVLNKQGVKFKSKELDVNFAGSYSTQQMVDADVPNSCYDAIFSIVRSCAQQGYIDKESEKKIKEVVSMWQDAMNEDKVHLASNFSNQINEIVKVTKNQENSKMIKPVIAFVYETIAGVEGLKNLEVKEKNVTEGFADIINEAIGKSTGSIDYVKKYDEIIDQLKEIKDTLTTCVDDNSKEAYEIAQKLVNELRVVRKQIELKSLTGFSNSAACKNLANSWAKLTINGKAVRKINLDLKDDLADKKFVENTLKPQVLAAVKALENKYYEKENQVSAISKKITDLKKIAKEVGLRYQKKELSEADAKSFLLKIQNELKSLDTQEALAKKTLEANKIYKVFADQLSNAWSYANDNDLKPSIIIANFDNLDLNSLITFCQIGDDEKEKNKKMEASSAILFSLKKLQDAITAASEVPANLVGSIQNINETSDMKIRDGLENKGTESVDNLLEEMGIDSSSIEETVPELTTDSINTLVNESTESNEESIEELFNSIRKDKNEH